MTMSIPGILAIVALVLAVLALLDIGRAGTALALAVICLALAILLPHTGTIGRGGTRL